MQKPHLRPWVLRVGFAYLTTGLLGCPQDSPADADALGERAAPAGRAAVATAPPTAALSGMYESFYAPNVGTDGIGMSTRYSFAAPRFDSCVTQIRGVAGTKHIRDSGTYQVGVNVLRLFSSSSGGSQELSLSYDPARPSELRIGGARFTRTATSAPLCD